MKIFEETEEIVVSPMEMEALSGYFAENAEKFKGWKITVDMEYGIAQRIGMMLNK